MERYGPESVLVLTRQAPWGEGVALAPGAPGDDDLRVLAAARGPAASDDPCERSALGALVLRAHAWLTGTDAREAPSAATEAPVPWVLPELRSRPPKAEA